MCRSVVAADDDDPPIPLDLPKGLVSESAFKWPGDPIARGGMAQIFAGEDRRLGRTVILKAPREDENLPAGMSEMFQRRVTAEARVLAKLQHPAIVTLFELGKASVGWPFCVLEKVDGVSLRDRLDELADEEERDGQPRTHERLELLSNLVAIAEALAYAHEHHVVHRDVTPNNILLGKRGEATLIDWGIARDLDAPAGPRAVAARSRSVAERAHGDDQRRHAAVLAARAVAGPQGGSVVRRVLVRHHALRGRVGQDAVRVERASSVGGKSAQIDAFLAWLQSEDAVPPAMPRDPELSGIIARAMTRDPGQRFTSDELVRALKQYLTGDLVFSHRYSITGRLARWARRNRAATVAVLALLALAIGGALVWAQLSRQAKEEAELRAVAAAAHADASEKERAADRGECGCRGGAGACRAGRARGQGCQAAAARGRTQAARRRGDAEGGRVRGVAGEGRCRRGAREVRAGDEGEGGRVQGARHREDRAGARREGSRHRASGAGDRRDGSRRRARLAERRREGARCRARVTERRREGSRRREGRARGCRTRARCRAGRADGGREGARCCGRGACRVERERDDARAKVRELEAKLREQGAGGPPPQPAPAPAPGPVTQP